MKKIKRVVSFILVFAICFTVMGNNIAFAESYYHAKNITHTCEGKYLLKDLERDNRFIEQNEYFEEEGIGLKQNLKSILKYRDNTFRISYAIEDGDKLYEITYILDCSRQVVLQDKKVITFLDENKLSLEWTFDNESFIDVIVNKDGTIESDGVIYANDIEFVNDIIQKGNVQTFGFCEAAMAALCGTGGGAACYGTCGIKAIATKIGGLACAIVCGLISSLGCYGATVKICG